MAQNNINKFQLVRVSGVSGAGWTPLKCPLDRAYTLTLKNRDASVALEFSTCSDGSDSDTIAANGERTFALANNGPGWQGPNEIVLWMKGAVTAQPSAYWLG